MLALGGAACALLVSGPLTASARCVRFPGNAAAGLFGYRDASTVGRVYAKYGDGVREAGVAWMRARGRNARRLVLCRALCIRPQLCRTVSTVNTCSAGYGEKREGWRAARCYPSAQRKTPREVAAWRLYVWRAALPVGKLCCRTPSFCSLVGSIGFEPTTPTMSRWCSNQLSYEPKKPRIIERVFEEHKPFRENFLNRRVRGRRSMAPGDAGHVAFTASHHSKTRRCAVMLSTLPSG